MFEQVTIDWQGRATSASVPPALAGAGVDLPEPVVRATERAAAAVRRAGDRLPQAWEPLARLLLRSEGVASSAVEEVRAPVEEVAAAEVLPDAGGPSAWVADNLSVVADAVGTARRSPLTVETVLRWHARLMRHATDGASPGLAGRFRDRPVWVGGRGPLDAAYVAPPHALVPELMDDLVGFANGETLDVVTQAAVLHAQFESIHPFADGNGRIGRALIGWLLVRRLDVPVPPPFSVYVARDPGGYLSGLAFYQLGEVPRWVQWFAATLERSASTALSLAAGVESLMDEWRARAGRQGRTLRRGATPGKLIDLLPEHPLVSASLVADRFGVTPEAGRQAIHQLASLGILEPLSLPSGGPGRPVHWWAARELLDLVAETA
ncbi:MAG TPA: Fic family protein [Acidimicrobiales bacterium]|nr:Fic family protein [Acidimicrobiales bacterium]